MSKKGGDKFKKLLNLAQLAQKMLDSLVKERGVLLQRIKNFEGEYGEMCAANRDYETEISTLKDKCQNQEKKIQYLAGKVRIWQVLCLSGFFIFFCILVSGLYVYFNKQADDLGYYSHDGEEGEGDSFYQWLTEADASADASLEAKKIVVPDDPALKADDGPTVVLPEAIVKVEHSADRPKKVYKAPVNIETTVPELNNDGGPDYVQSWALPPTSDDSCVGMFGGSGPFILKYDDCLPL